MLFKMVDYEIVFLEVINIKYKKIGGILCFMFNELFWIFYGLDNFKFLCVYFEIKGKID